jgi:DNA-binding transcriptional ArsR family regulator
MPMGTLTLDDSLAGFAEKATEAATMLKALSNEKRLMILCKLLEHGEMSVNALIGHVGLSQSALSQHLARMREEKIVDTRRDAQQIFYRVADPRVREILKTLKNTFC